MLSGDVAFALAMQILGIEEQCTKPLANNFPTFVHMKSHVQEIPATLIEDDWTKSLPTYYNNYNDFKIGNFQQLLPFHYVEKNWMKPDMVKQMEKEFGF